jgi:hypothetical protein
MNFPTASTPTRVERQTGRGYCGIGSTPNRDMLDLRPQNLREPENVLPGYTVDDVFGSDTEEEIVFPSDSESDDSTISPPTPEPLSPSLESISVELYDEHTDRLVFNKTGSLFD